MRTLTFDIETYSNYVLFALRDVDTKELITFEIKGTTNTLTNKEIKELRKLLTESKIVTFNGIKFDEPITAYAFEKKNATEIFKAVKTLIETKTTVWMFYHEMAIKPFITHHIDIMDVARGQASLKLYSARLGAKKLQDLPYEPETVLTKKQMKEVYDYCENDNIITEDLYNYLETDLALRTMLGEQYGLNFMSYKGAKIAEVVIATECGYEGKAIDIPTHVDYVPPKYIKFKTPDLKAIFKKIKKHKFLMMRDDVMDIMRRHKLEDEYSFLLEDIGLKKSEKQRHSSKSKKTISNSGSVISPDFFDKPISIDGVEYKLGLGGVHGSVVSKTIIPKDDELIVDIDYQSLYPSLIIQNGFVPTHLGKKFLSVFSKMYNDRNFVLKPKLKTLEYGSEEYIRTDREQDILKLILNSYFGQTGQRFAKVYDPSAMLHTTITGQLTLMMVIEKLHLKGYVTFYANTDGITLIIKKKDLPKVQKITQKFDKKTGLVMEYNFFKSSHIRDVNNFVNITDDDKVKSKGVFGEPSIEKNSQVPIVFEAIRTYLLNGTSLEETIRACKNVNDFCTSRLVTGGAIYKREIPEMYPHDWDEKLNSTRGLTKKIIGEREKMRGTWVQENGEYLGKVVRWYYGINGNPIYYKKSGNKVPLSDGAIPMMTLSKKLPKDIDYNWYIEYAERMLEELGT